MSNSVAVRARYMVRSCARQPRDFFRGAFVIDYYWIHERVVHLSIHRIYLLFIHWFVVIPLVIFNNRRNQRASERARERGRERESGKAQSWSKRSRLRNESKWVNERQRRRTEEREREINKENSTDRATKMGQSKSKTTRERAKKTSPNGSNENRKKR